MQKHLSPPLVYWFARCQLQSAVVISDLYECSVRAVESDGAESRLIKV